MKYRPAALLLWFSLAMVFFACDPGKVADDYQTIPDATWAADSAHSFTFNIARTNQNNNIYFNVRNDRTYEFSNLWLFVTIESPSGVSLTDTVQVMLAEPSGKWLGKGFSGVYDNRLIYRRNVYFPESGKYAIRLKHGMRPENLKGITDIGIRVEKVN